MKKTALILTNGEHLNILGSLETEIVNATIAQLVEQFTRNE